MTSKGDAPRWGRWVVAWLVVAMPAAAQVPATNPYRALVRAYLWPADTAAFLAVDSMLREDASLVGLNRMQWHDVEEAFRAGPDRSGGAPGGGVDTLVVRDPVGGSIPVLVRRPPGYRADRPWPALLAMHGGPPGAEAGARRSAERMVAVWSEAADRGGWIVVAPAMVSTVAGADRTRDRLPYEIFHPEQARTVMRAVASRYAVHPDRIVSTGISLGSNFSLGFAAAHPDWWAAIVPVSTEGESREHVLRNLRIPTYVLEGTQDQNIRTVSGPRSLAAILRSFGVDLVYREFGDRAHEGFQDHYDDVLRWLDARPRDLFPREVLRVPHRGIMPPARRRYWLRADARGSFLHATIDGNRIAVTARWAGELTVALHDRLVDLDRPVEILVNGVPVFDAVVPRSLPTALRAARDEGDHGWLYAAEVRVGVPQADADVAVARRAWEALAPTHPEGPLSFWETYADRALRERFPRLGLEGVEVEVPPAVRSAPEQVAMRITSVDAGSPWEVAGVAGGDVLVSMGDEPFFAGREGLATLYEWLLRELRSRPTDYPLVVWRAGRRVTTRVRLALGPSRAP